jgi:hypothetical protein
MSATEIDARLRPLFDEIQKARTWGVTHDQLADTFERAIGRTDFERFLETRKNAKLQPGNLREKRKHYSPSYKQKLYDHQGGACPWCPEPLFIPAKRNEVDHINVNLPPEEYETRKNHCLAHPKCNRSKNATSLADLSKRTGITMVEILSKGLEA